MIGWQMIGWQAIGWHVMGWHVTFRQVIGHAGKREEAANV